MKTFITTFITISVFAAFLLNTSMAIATIDIERIEAALSTRVLDGTIGVGISMAIVDGDKTAFISVGKANKEESFRLDSHSVFEIGSITKTFTGLLLADMVIKGEVKPNDTVEQFLPDGITIPARSGRKITLLDLVTHRSSLPRLPANLASSDWNNPYADYTVDDMYHFLSEYRLPREIGSKAEYSNLGMGLLGHALALKAGLSYEQLLRERILGPLGMNDTAIRLNESQEARLATGHDVAAISTSNWDLPTFAGAGALRSTASDMAIYLAVNMGIVESPLSKAIILSHKFQRAFQAEHSSIGYAWLTSSSSSGEITWHNGGTGGYRSFIGFDKARSVGVVVLANSQDDPDLIANAIFSDEINAIIVEKYEDVNASNDALNKFEGDYKLARKFVLTISVAEGRLFAQATGQQKFPLFSRSKTEYYFKAVDASIAFNIDRKGEVKSLILHQNGKHKARKIR